MASSKDSIIYQVAQRLRVEGASLRKAEALHRLLMAKDSTKSINCTTKAVICLDLATSLMAVPFDKDSAIKLSGAKKSMYQNHLNNIESVLQLNKPLTISEICVKMSCTDIRTIAEDILDKYELHNAQMDLNHAQYPVAAVYAACKFKNIKVQRNEFVVLSKLKLSGWKDLEAQFTSFVSKIGLLKSGIEKASSNSLYKTLEKRADIDANDSQQKSTLEDSVEVEEYEIWKRRILEEARRQLGIDN